MTETLTEKAVVTEAAANTAREKTAMTETEIATRTRTETRREKEKKTG